MTVRAVSRAFIALWLALGLYFVHQGLELRLGSISSPGTGFMPFVVGLVLIGFGIASVVPLSIPSVHPARLHIQRLRDPAIVVAAMITYVLVLERIGFVASTAILIVFLMSTVGRTTLFRAAIVGISAPVGCYLVFGMLLGVRLP